MALTEMQIAQVGLNARNGLLSPIYQNHVNVLTVDDLAGLLFSADEERTTLEAMKPTAETLIANMVRTGSVKEYRLGGGLIGYAASDDRPWKIKKLKNPDPWAWTT